MASIYVALTTDCSPDTQHSMEPSTVWTSEQPEGGPGVLAGLWDRLFFRVCSPPVYACHASVAAEGGSRRCRGRRHRDINCWVYVAVNIALDEV